MWGHQCTGIYLPFAAGLLERCSHLLPAQTSDVGLLYGISFLLWFELVADETVVSAALSSGHHSHV